MTEPTHRLPPHQEALFAPLRRDDLPSFLVLLPDMHILAATPACAALGIEVDAPAPLGVKIVAKRVGMSLRPAPRLERVRLPNSFVPKPFACIAVQGPSGQVVVFADPLALATGATSAKALPGLTRLPAVRPAPTPPRPGGRSVRFTWEADAAGRLLRLSPHAAEAMGTSDEQWVGRDFDELADAGLLLDGAPMRAALRSGGSFFGLTLLTAEHPPRRLEFGGVPLFDVARRRHGTRGFGLLWGDQDSPPATAGSQQASASGTGGDGQGFNVVPLRGAALTARERSAFHEIARTLTEAIEEWPRPPAALPAPGDADRSDVADLAPNDGVLSSELMVREADGDLLPPGSGTAPQAAPPPPRADVASDAAEERGAGEEHLLDRLPIGIVVQQGGVTVRVNRTLLGWLGLKDTADFTASGGLSPRLVRDARTGGLDLESIDGDRMPVEVRLVSSPWENRPALVHVIRSLEGAVAPQPAPVAPPAAAPSVDAERVAPPVAPLATETVLTANHSALTRAERASARRQALDFVPFPVLLLDRNGTVETANLAAAELCGFMADDLENEPFTLLLAQDSQVAAVAMLDRASATAGAGSQQGALTVRHRLGTRLPVEAVLAPAGEANIRFCLIMREVSEQPASADFTPATAGPDLALESRSAAPHMADSIDGLVRRISHDVRDPLTAVLAFVDSVKQSVFGPVGNARYLRHADAAAAAGENLLAILSDLDGLATMPAGPGETIALAPVIEAALAHLAEAAQRRRILMRSSLPPSLTAHCDPPGLARLVRLILEEALRATPAEGQIIVSLAEDDAAPDTVLIQIRDGGPALSETEISQALDPTRPAPVSDRFTRAGRPFRMAHAARLARAQGGTLDFKRGVDIGMLAQVRLPAGQPSR